MRVHLPLSYPGAAGVLTRLMLIVAVTPVLALLVGCGGSTMPLSKLLEAESLPGNPETSGPVNPQLAELGENAEAMEVAQQGDGVARDAAEEHELRVMSFNVRFRNMLDLGNNWPNRRELFIATVRRFDPDLLGTQESLFSQTQDIQAALPDYGYFGAGRADGADSGEMCGVFYRKDRFRKLDGGHFWLSRNPDQPGSRAWFEPFPRMVTWVKLEMRDGSHEPFYFFNTHFAAFSRRARDNSAELMRERIASITNGAPTIVAGDFNATEDSHAYRVMRDGLSPDSRTFKDTYRKAHPEPSAHENTIHRFRGTTRGQRIDWILASEPFETLAAAIDRTHYNNRYPSDHFPVHAVLTWPKADGEPAVAAGEADRDEPDDS